MEQEEKRIQASLQEFLDSEKAVNGTLPTQLTAPKKVSSLSLVRVSSIELLIVVVLITEYHNSHKLSQRPLTMNH